MKFFHQKAKIAVMQYRLDWQSAAYVPFSVNFKMFYSNEKSVLRKPSQLLRRGGRFQEVPKKEIRLGTF